MSDKMIWLLCTGITVFALIDPCRGVSTKMDFGDDEGASTFVSNSTGSDDEDVEVKHTIIVSTKLKNGNKRGLHGSSDGEKGVVTYNIGSPRERDDSEVPVIKGYKSVETTEIKTPDIRFKAPPQLDSVFINRNIRDEYDIYPNYISNPSQWKPSNIYNNINWMSQDMSRRPGYQSPGKFNRRISDEGVKEFYCRKCMELSDGQVYKGCAQQRSNSRRYLYETTTPKIKIDGKLAKLN